MKAVRAALVVAILLNLALLAAAGPLRSTLARYDLARKQQELRKLGVENRALLGQAAEARRPDRVAARAARMGIDLRLLENEALVNSEAVSSAPKPAINTPPRR